MVGAGARIRGYRGLYEDNIDIIRAKKGIGQKAMKVGNTKKGRCSMKKVVSLFLAVAFLVSVSGCVGRTEYDRLVSEKTDLEKKSEELSLKETELKNEISSRREEIKTLRSELRDAKRKIQSLEREMTKLERSEVESKEVSSE